MENVFFTSDLHLGHEAIIKFQPRPFNSVEEMDEILIQNWNSRISKSDRVYMLGDFSWISPRHYLHRMNGNIHWINGNHDKASRNWLLDYKNIKSVQDIKTITVHGVSICLCHYAMRVWNKSCHNQWHLYGHSHGGVAGAGKSFDVGVDCHDYMPIEFAEVEAIMAMRPDNNRKTLGYDGDYA